ncbi:diguanylate cyclase [Rhizobium sp. KVB221]|uniref:diguanylate cyclase n=1 Tax=Rhizobium setariae TaxID=2801340 RepID=A0A937CQM1_9HYPH|nr:diguanylate cyclase [Rhizobium setariae]MBL0373192.1 diguanylate cyclase [Rhizobium setariae]
MPRKHEGRQILLVEDTRFYSIAIRERLEALFGLKVTHCATFSGLRHELNQSPDAYGLAIVDLFQTDAPNGEAVDFILSQNLPLIVFSGISSDQMREQIIAKKAVDYVAKSSEHSIDRLAAAVDRCLTASMAEILVIDSVGKTTMPDSLRRCGFSPVVASNDAEALAVLDKARNIELVLVRADLAAKRNFALVQTLRSRYGEDAIRIVGYSEVTGHDDVARFLGGGGDEFIHLPVSAEDLAGRLSHVLGIHRRIRVLQRMASRDFLTDLFNRRYFFDLGPKLVEMSLRQSQPVSMALLDIDHFKRLNDTYGHEIGDLVLKAVSKKLISLVGESQHLVARLGGEEFGILFTGLDIEGAYDYCELVRKEISRVRVVVDEEDLSVTISMGLANISASETFDNYLNAADQYLYMAKHSGRNRVFSDYQVSRIMAS